MRGKTFLIIAGTLASMALSVGRANAQVLFTTQEDFAGWTDNNGQMFFVGAPAASPDSDGSSINGLGNTTNPGGVGTPGSEQITWQPAAGTYNYFYSTGEQTNTAFLSAIDPGSSAGNLVSYSGTLSIDYTVPPANGGNYYQLGIVLNYSSNFGQFFGGNPVGPNANGFMTVTIPYTINAVSGLGYFQMGIIYNSNYTGTPFNLDNIQVVPEPASLGLAGLGALGLLRRRRS